MDIIGQGGGRPATLTDTTPPEGQKRPAPRETASPKPGEKKGLLHKLPFFWKR